MDISNLRRDSAQIHAALIENKDTLVALKPVKIYVPETYIGSPLGSIEDVTRIVGIWGMTVEDKYYAVSRACATMQIAPSATNVVNIGAIKYMEFIFEAGDTVISNLNLVRTGTLVYRIYNEIIAKGKIPWYLDYTDLCYLFDTSKSHGNANLKANSAILELIASAMARQAGDKTKYFRNDPAIVDDINASKPVLIPLRYVALQASNTVSRLLGSYFQEGVTSALITPTETVESIETLLRA